jgi:hypothetical protein
MRRQGRAILLVGLAAVGLAGAAVIVAAQGGAADLDEQYKQRLAKVDPKKAEDLVGLAKWCYQVDLTGQASAHALEALALAPDDVRAKYIVYAAQLTGGGDGGAGPDVATGGAKVTITQKDADGIYAREGETQMTRFKNQVQGMLFVRCAMPQCHGGAKEAKYVIVRQGPGSRRTIAQNFQAINTYIDREKPDESRLLLKPLKGPEAGHPRRAITGTTDPTYKAMLDWIKTLKTQGAMLWDDTARQKANPTPEGNK